MKKLFLLLTLTMPMMLFGQTYETLWKQVGDAQDSDLPQTAQQVLRKIAAKAQKEKAYGHLLKAELADARMMCSVSPDSLEPAVARLALREQQTTDGVMRAVLQTVLGYIYDNQRVLGDDAKEKARRYYGQALADPAMLAAVKSSAYEPLVLSGTDSRIYGDDLLSIIGYEAGRFDVLRDYYTKTGNRPAAMLSTLEWLRSTASDEMEPVESSVGLQRLDSLIEAYGDLPETGEAAIERYRRMDGYTTATARQKWEYIDMALKRWGSWPRMNELRNARQSLSAVQFSTMSDAVILPRRPFPIAVTNLRGVEKLTMQVYRVEAKAADLLNVAVNTDAGYRKIKPLLKAQQGLSQIRSYAGKAPYEIYSDSIVLGALPVGIYMLEFQSTPTTRRTERLLFYVSGLRLLSQKLPDEQMRYVVVDAESGQPVAGAQVRVDRRTQSVTLTTNRQGECLYASKGERPVRVLVSTAADHACPELSGYGYFSYYNNDRVVRHTEIYTDRSIYRPGQPVHASALLYQTADGYRNSVLKGETVTARLRDANNKVVGEQTLTTDDYGTCAADFVLPRNVLSGSFSLEMGNNRHYFRVEEYKRPAFEVEMPAVKENYADGDTVKVKATARSYAGVPVQGARVKYKVERRRAFWWWSYSYYWNQGAVGEGTDDELLASGETVTDANGAFDVSVPMVLPKTRHPMFYNFVVSADVTDQAGESHHGELSLPLGNRKTALSVDLADKVLVDKGDKMTFHWRNAAGTDLDAQVKYRVDAGAWRTVKTLAPVAVPLLKSGRHTLEAVCGTDTLKRDFVAFSLADRRPATETDDWFFVSDTQFPDNGGEVTLQVGSSAPDVHMVYTIMAGNTLVESGVVDKSNELVNRKFTYKEAYGNGLLITYAWVKQGKYYVHEATLRRPLPDNKLKLKWQTFRNRLVPGQQEEWTLTVTGPDGQPAKAQLLATLYDKSLDQLALHHWVLSPYVWLPMPTAKWNCSNWTFSGCHSVLTETMLPVAGLQLSRFDHDVYPSAYFATLGFGRNRMYMVKAMAAPESAREEAMTYDSAVLAPQELTAEDVEAEKKTANAGAVGQTTDESDAGASQGESVQMRENLQETAFFYPQLTTDADGRVALKFTLPESLTTWRFMGVAHTQDMMAGTLTDEAVARKDVMIQPNMPRFVREGDEAAVSARVFNTGGSTLNATVRLELADPESLQTVFADEQQVVLAPDSTLAVTFRLANTHFSQTLLIAKMSVAGQGFSDGEQHYLPILPNRERVTVTVPFTQNEPGTKTVDLSAMNAPSADAGQATLTIEYTNNPAWLMIQALPAVGHPHDNCAICQAGSYYANAIGRHLLQQNPQAKSVFEAWSREQGSETSLMSSLQKNASLKDLVLDETPWVADANREQEQKERLADFFDAALMQQRIDGALSNLKQLQRSDGSWCWWPDMPGSMYMTVEISEMLVRLNEMTTRQTESTQMLDKAFGFMGKEIVQLVDEMKKETKKGWTARFPSHMALQWLYICTLDGRQLPARVRDANAWLLKLLKKETRNQSIYDKAMSAIVLGDKTYVKSLKEYTVWREDLGRYYDTPRALYSWRNYRIPTQVAAIEAIKRLTPDDRQTIEEMQRWLLQEKRSQAWDTPINSADAVYAFLDGNSQALQPQAKTMLKVDGQPVETSEATAGIGYVKTTMSGQGKQTFTAEKTSDGTSWGAVYMQFMQSVGNIEQQNSGIGVKREIVSAEADAPLKVGDCVKVRITITADRDYDFVQVVDKRAACMEPVSQLSGYRWGYYTTPKDYATHYYFDLLPKGRHIIETEYYIDRAGSYQTGTCTAECAYSPEFRGTAQSLTIEVK